MFGKKKKKESEEQKWEIVKEGKIKDMDYIVHGNRDQTYYHLQFKFEDGTVILATYINRYSCEKIKIGDNVKIKKNINVFSFSYNKHEITKIL